MDKNDAINAVVRFGKALENQGLKVGKLILFGSYANGNAFRKPFTGRAIAYTSTASFFNRFMFIKVISSIICIAFL